MKPIRVALLTRINFCARWRNSAHQQTLFGAEATGGETMRMITLMGTAAAALTAATGMIITIDTIGQALAFTDPVLALTLVGDI
jgi:hypothetical protein